MSPIRNIDSELHSTSAAFYHKELLISATRIIYDQIISSLISNIFFQPSFYLIGNGKDTSTQTVCKCLHKRSGFDVKKLESGFLENASVTAGKKDHAQLYSCELPGGLRHPEAHFWLQTNVRVLWATYHSMWEGMVCCCHADAWISHHTRPTTLHAVGLHWAVMLVFWALCGAIASSKKPDHWRFW